MQPELSRLRRVVSNPYGARLMTALARLVLRRRRAIVFLWLALTLIGAYSANAVSKRWLEQFSIPGYSAYEANQRALKTFGTGENAPLVAVFHSNGDLTRVTAIKPAIGAAAKQNPGSRVSSYFSTGSDAYVLRVNATSVGHLEAVIETLGRFGTPTTSIILSSPVAARAVAEPPVAWPLARAATRRAAERGGVSTRR